MKSRRKKLLIEPHFQTRLIFKLAGWVALATIVTAAIVYIFLTVADQQSAGEFFYVVQEPGTHPELLSRTEIVLPALLVSLFANLVLTLVFALYYSQKLAGPVHRLILDMGRLVRGEKMKAHFQLRGSDEFQDVGHSFDALLKKLAEKGFLKEK